MIVVATVCRPEMQTTPKRTCPPCHWLIATPYEGLSPACCKHCGAEREFDNIWHGSSVVFPVRRCLTCERDQAVIAFVSGKAKDCRECQALNKAGAIEKGA